MRVWAILGDLREFRSILTRDFRRFKASYHPRVGLSVQDNAQFNISQGLLVLRE
jgi:hypothetical protein